MNKYDYQYSNNRMDIPLMEGEEVIWKGKPKKSAFILGQVTQGILTTLIWLCIDAFFIYHIATSDSFLNGAMLFIIPFFALHLMPVWIWIKNVATARKRWENTLYCVTDRRILISDGFFAENFHTIYYKDIRGVNLHIGMQDKLCKTGDVILELYMPLDQKNKLQGGFYDIEDYNRVYRIVQISVLYIQTDMEYPNAYRPDDNPGYGTKWDG